MADGLPEVESSLLEHPGMRSRMEEKDRKNFFKRRFMVSSHRNVCSYPVKNKPDRFFL
jgi:hypothetical protein